VHPGRGGPGFAERLERVSDDSSSNVRAAAERVQYRGLRAALIFAGGGRRRRPPRRYDPGGALLFTIIGSAPYCAGCTAYLTVPAAARAVQAALSGAINSLWE